MLNLLVYVNRPTFALIFSYTIELDGILVAQDQLAFLHSYYPSCPVSQQYGCPQH